MCFTKWVLRSCDGIPSDSMSRANCFCLWNVATPSKTTCLQEHRILWLFFVSSWTLACCHNNHISHVACLVWSSSLSSQCWPPTSPRSAQGALLALCLPLLTSASPDHLPIHQQAYGYHQIQVGPSWLHGNVDEVVDDHNYDVLLPVLYQPCQYHPARGPRSSRIHLPRISRPLQVPLPHHSKPNQSYPLKSISNIHAIITTWNATNSNQTEPNQNLPYRTNHMMVIIFTMMIRIKILMINELTSLVTVSQVWTSMERHFSSSMSSQIWRQSARNTLSQLL